MIGERLYDLRKDAGMTQDELAELLKISKHSISAYERDKNEPPDSIKIAIARLFNVSVDYLVGLSDMPTPANSSRVLPLPSNFPSDLQSCTTHEKQEHGKRRFQEKRMNRFIQKDVEFIRFCQSNKKRCRR